MRLLDIAAFQAVEHGGSHRDVEGTLCPCDCCGNRADASDSIAKDFYDIKKQLGGQEPKYAILSHRWQSSEIKLNDLPAWKRLRDDKTSPKLQSVLKLEQFCSMARLEGYDYAWMDSCCINQKDPVELSTSINSMYRWYQESDLCIVYLSDFDSSGYQYDDIEGGNVVVRQCTDPGRSHWFGRGWTLQELVAPKKVKFFDRNWIEIGSRNSQVPAPNIPFGITTEVIARATGIEPDILQSQKNIASTSIAHRMSWVGRRSTTVPEDTAYCLLGIFGVNMPLLYGEGLERAFRRLQEEIMEYSDDHSLFAWRSPSGEEQTTTGLLAPSPKCFQSSGSCSPRPDPLASRPFFMTNKGIQISLRLMQGATGEIATLECEGWGLQHLSIYLKRVSETQQEYVRIQSDKICQVGQPGGVLTIFVRQNTSY
ncbi:hypothetical protein E8E14_000408 [Neopestalotiopsis sp. 37M]|nr:hypothetical protein E8E14_000408 [Neopestalotiopsis sp. 37M]